MLTTAFLDTLSCTDPTCPQAGVPHKITADVIHMFRASCHPKDGLLRACYVHGRHSLLLSCGTCGRPVEELAVGNKEEQEHVRDERATPPRP